VYQDVKERSIRNTSGIPLCCDFFVKKWHPEGIKTCFISEELHFFLQSYKIRKAKSSFIWIDLWIDITESLSTAVFEE
jgi:hypothetical protein